MSSLCGYNIVRRWIGEGVFHDSRPELGQHVTSSEEVKEGRDEEDES